MVGFNIQHMLMGWTVVNHLYVEMNININLTALFLNDLCVIVNYITCIARCK